MVLPTDLRTAAAVVFANGPGASPYQPPKEDIRDLLAAVTALDKLNSNVVSAPPIYAHSSGDYNGLPPNNATQAHYNVVLAPGFREGLSLFPANNAIRRSTFVGTEVGTRLEQAERVEAIGNASLKFAKWAERCTLLGSLTGQWLGINPNEDASGKAWLHDLLYNGGVPPSNPSWNAFGLNDIDSTLRAELAAFSAWATGRDDVRANVLIGRDAANQLVKGVNNTALGYRAGAMLFNGDENTFLGYYAGFAGVFGSQNTHVGVQAGQNRTRGSYNSYFGYNSGYSHKSGDGNVILGRNSGNSVTDAGAASYWSGSGNVLIGRDAGRRPNGTVPDMSNVLMIQNFSTRRPLIQGDFEGGRVGINVPHDALRASIFSVWMGDSGFSGAIGTDGATALIESDNHTGLTLLTPAEKIGGIYMGKPGAAQQGGISYNHATDEMRIRTAGANRLSVGASKLYHTGLPSSNPGAGGGFWYDPSDANRVKYAA